MTEPTEMPEEDSVEEIAVLHVIGALEDDERRAFEARLDHDPAAREAVAGLSPVVTELLRSVTPLAPPPRLKDALFEKIDAARGDAATRPEHFLLRSRGGTWEASGFPGVEIQTLFTDAERDIRTFLMRVAPGAIIPPHSHKGAEECYVLSGDLHTVDTELGPGDYLRFPDGSTHTESKSEAGCLLLVTASTEDED